MKVDLFQRAGVTLTMVESAKSTAPSSSAISRWGHGDQAEAVERRGRGTVDTDSVGDADTEDVADVVIGDTSTMRKPTVSYVQEFEERLVDNATMLFLDPEDGVDGGLCETPPETPPMHVQRGLNTGGMYRDNDDEEEVGSASSAAGRTPGVGHPSTSIRLALRITDDRFEN
jgi:hypothetical protein